MANLTLDGAGGRSPTGPLPRGAALEVAGLSVSRGGIPVLHGVDLHVPAGRIVALLGASGCGKTTLLRAIAGLEDPTAGTVRAGGRVLVGEGVRVPAERRRIGMVFQDWALFPHLSVERNVAFGLTRKQQRAGMAREALGLVGLAALTDRLPATLSGGQQQRVAVARALAPQPDVLLLDEPFSNLDAGLRGQVREEVTALLRELAVTTVIVTHDQEEAFLLGDEVAVLADGLIAQQAAPAELYATPRTRSVAQFLGDANLVRAEADGLTAHTPLGPVPLQSAARGAVEVLLRPEHLVLSPGGRSQVTEIRFYGHDAVCVVADADVRWLVRTLSAPTVTSGEAVSLAYVGPPVVAYPT